MTDAKKVKNVATIHLILILIGVVNLPFLFIISWWKNIVFMFTISLIISWIIFRGCLLLQLENKYRRELNIETLGNKAFIQFYLEKLFKIPSSRIAVRICLYSYLITTLIVAILR